MVVAYVLITVRHGTNKEVIEKLMDIKEVEEANILYGQYDIIAKIKINDMRQLDELVFKKIKIIPYVESTETLISSDIV